MLSCECAWLLRSERGAAPAEIRSSLPAFLSFGMAEPEKMGIGIRLPADQIRVALVLRDFRTIVRQRARQTDDAPRSFHILTAASPIS